MVNRQQKFSGMSKGFIVVEPFAKGEELKDAMFGVIDSDDIFNRVRVPNVNFALNWIVSKDTDPESQFYHHINKNQIFASGYSRGAETVLTWQASAPNPLIKAVFAGQAYPGAVSPSTFGNIKVPTFIQASSDPLNSARDIPHEQPLFDALGTTIDKKYLVGFQGTSHFTYVDPCNLASNYYIPLGNALTAAGFGGYPAAIAYYFAGPNVFGGTEGCLYTAIPPLVNLSPQDAQDLYLMYEVSFFNVYGINNEEDEDEDEDGNSYKRRLTPDYAIKHHLPIIMEYNNQTYTPTPK
jgi:hypothetical protein